MYTAHGTYIMQDLTIQTVLYTITHIEDITTHIVIVGKNTESIIEIEVMFRMLTEEEISTVQEVEHIIKMVV